MAGDEKGYIQFHCRHESAGPMTDPIIVDLIMWRNYLRERQLIGIYPDGIGYGNISARLRDGTFVISASATGGLEIAGPEHFTQVTQYDYDRNTLTCRGPVRASSESLSHAAVYEGDSTAHAIIHIHHSDLWERKRGHW